MATPQVPRRQSSDTKVSSYVAAQRRKSASFPAQAPPDKKTVTRYEPVIRRIWAKLNRFTVILIYHLNLEKLCSINDMLLLLTVF